MAAGDMRKTLSKGRPLCETAPPLGTSWHLWGTISYVKLQVPWAWCHWGCQGRSWALKLADFWTKLAVLSHSAWSLMWWWRQLLLPWAASLPSRQGQWASILPRQENGWECPDMSLPLALFRSIRGAPHHVPSMLKPALHGVEGNSLWEVGSASQTSLVERGRHPVNAVVFKLL